MTRPRTSELRSGAFEALAKLEQAELAQDIQNLLERFHVGGDALVVPSEYLEVVIHRS